MENDFSGKMNFNKEGFVEINLPNTFKDFNGWWHFNKSDARKGLEDIWEDNIHYRFFRLLVNPLADKELSEYIGTFRWVKGGNEGKSDFKKVIKKSENNLRFDYKLKDEYLFVLNKLKEESIGKSSFACFKSVDEERGGSNWLLSKSVNFPVNCIVKNVYSGVFKDLVNSLNDDKAYNLLKRIEHPQNYNMNRIEILRKKKINPFVSEGGFVVSSDTLKNLANFLLPFKLKYERDNDNCVHENF
jgi:hypothetical protein